jgi:hypothetical protein
VEATTAGKGTSSRWRLPFPRIHVDWPRGLPTFLSLYVWDFEIPSHHPEHAPELGDAAQVTMWQSTLAAERLAVSINAKTRARFRGRLVAIV